MATFRASLGLCYAQQMGRCAETAVERASQTLRSVRAGRASRRPVTLLPSLATAACSFETQPIFDSQADSVVSADPASAQEHDAAHTDLTTNRFTTQAAVADCTPDELSCCDENTLATRRSDGKPIKTETCASHCNADGMAGAACKVCAPGSVLGCDGTLAVRRCAADGSGEDRVVCPNGCSNGTCTGSCVPGTTSCSDGLTLRTCDASGGASERACSAGCSALAGGAACNACLLNALVCRGQTSMMTTTPCTHGCDASTGKCSVPRLSPSNLTADTCDVQSDADAEPSGNTSLDTDANCSSVEQPPGGGREICVVRHRDLHICAGAVINVSGTRVLALVASRSLRVDGVISVAAHGGNAGPGAQSSGVGLGHAATSRVSGTLELPASAGGGGCGYAVKGGMGGGMDPSSARPAASGMAGQDGRRSAVAAAGGAAGGLGSAAGGVGGTSNARGAGGAATHADAAAGGGGGAAARIRVNSESGSTDLTGLVVSPRATFGVARSE